MKLPRSAWSWSAFQVDTALFMYGGVSTVAIPVEAITTPAPKVKEPRPLQRSKSKRKSLKRSSDLGIRYPPFQLHWHVAMSLHGLGVIGAQVAASIKTTDEKTPTTPNIAPPRCSITSSPGAHSQEFDPSIGAKPCSPFYPHTSPTISYEQLTFETKNANRRSQLRDLESLGPYASCRTDSPRRSKLWEEENKPLTWFQTLSNKQRMALKAVVAVVTVGTMIAIALGITAAVGGAGWKVSAEKTAAGG
ncbi:unnamed protein product [Penicillium palitans]